MGFKSLKTSLDWHTDTARQLYAIMPLWILLTPLLFMIILLGLDQTALSTWMDKQSAEIAAPSILAIALLTALWQMKTNTHIYFKWQAFFALILFFRELHFYGTNNGFYIGFILMMWWASKNRDRLLPYFQNPTIVSIIVLIIWTYLISKSFDRHYWDSLIPAGVESDLFEENLELIGHLLFTSLVVISAKLKLTNN
ncbi:MAG: hypothetical protein HKP55_11060 [Gammaproteobacteria bacterium]|nr:hypothetical protein [Gammaproteobacteria bacterium]NNJ92206.1 hypothetical protein [Gammaproteobacteria bacterium]